MPNAEEWCEVRTNYGTFRDWTSVAVRYDIDSNAIRHFQLELAEVTPTAAQAGIAGRVVDRPNLFGAAGVGTSLLRLKPGDRVDIAMAGKLVISNGYIKVRQSFEDANRHAVQVTGYAKAWPVTEVSIDENDHNGGQFRDYTLTAIANAVLKPLGVRFKLQNPPDGANEKFKNVIIHQGETPWDLISRLAAQRGVWLWSDVNGDIVGGVPQGGGGATLEHGRNIKAIRVYIEDPAVDEVIARSQASGSNELWGRKAAEISAKATLPGMPNASNRKRIVPAEHPNTEKELQARVNMEVSAILASILRVWIEHIRWKKPGSNDLWDLGESVVVKSPGHIIVSGGTLTLKVWGVTMLQDNQAGSITQVELVNEATFSQKYPNLGASNEYGRSATRAVPEAFA